MHYFTGKPCKRGHIAKRLVSDRSCMECNKEKRAKYYKENPEKYREERKKAYAANPEPEKAKAKVRSAEWRKNNPNHEGVKLAKKAYANSIEGKINRYVLTANRRAAKLQRTPKWLTKSDYTRISDFYKMAKELETIFPWKQHVDHIIPLQGDLASGLHVSNNLQIVPWFVNVLKANRYVPA